MQHPYDSKNHARVIHRSVWGATFVVPLWLLGSSSCAQGSSELFDDGGSDDASVGQDTASTPPVDTGGPPTPDATGSSSGSVGQTDSASADTWGSDTGGGEGATSEGGTDSSIDQHVNAPETGAESGTEAGQDAGSDVASDVVSGCACGPQAVCVSGVCTAARRVFVSSATYTGNLGGASGADTKCGTLAAQAGLGGTWMAWISDGTTSPGQRFIKATVAYRRLDGVQVATSFSDLATGLYNPVNIDEMGNSLANASSSASKTWTGTASSGTGDTSSCGGFASTSGTGEVGHCTSTSSVGWTAAYTGEQCSVANHIYCFEQ